MNTNNQLIPHIRDLKNLLMEFLPTGRLPEQEKAQIPQQMPLPLPQANRMPRAQFSPYELPYAAWAYEIPFMLPGMMPVGTGW